MGKIWIAGHGFDVDARVVRWDEGPGYNAHLSRCINTPKCPDGIHPFSEKAKNRRPNRFRFRPSLRRYGDRVPLQAAQAVIRQFVLHHDGCKDAKMCFHVLHNERGLSCHFLLDNDGTIYQTLDLAYMAFHAAGFNADSIGIEMANRGDAKKWPDYYRKRRMKRETTTVRIHNHIYKCFRFTPQQHEAMRALAKGLQRALPNLPLEYPQDSPGHQAWSELPNAKQFSGYLGHYHTTRRKWDPGPFDFKEFCEKARGSLCFPIFAKKDPKRFRPAVPEASDKLNEETDQLYRINEARGQGGYFPLGPYGVERESRLWHGGVHLSGELRQPIYAPFPGRLMAARMGSMSEVGSVNFVLLRHDMTVGTGSIRFFSLYFHLYDERKTDPKDKGVPEWLAAREWQRDKGNRRIVLLNEPIEAGRIIGRMGQGGPPGHRRPQMHFEIFSNEEVTERIVAENSDFLRERWDVIDGTVGGRFSKNPRINDLIDIKPKDGAISRTELLDFFRANPDRRLTRNLITLHTSEWIDSPSWYDSLKVAKEYTDLGDKELKNLVDRQIRPTIWWTDKVARHAKLPRDGVVYHYHPLSFVRFVNSMLLQAKALADDGIGDFDEALAEETPEGVTDDFGDESGDSFVDESELVGEVTDTELPLEELVKGFPD
ncbi:MAG: N-acetylmuramoyl-L-alanine amidase [Proteobacteria bacterium]|nr:N-acetylmuramoyl-L-alanine amidase [Pseudomonadota bacterium]